MSIRTRRRADLGKQFAEITVVAAEIVANDDDRWDIEFGDGVRARDQIVTRNAPNEGLARSIAVKIAKQCEAKGWRVMSASVRTYRWVSNDFDDREYGQILDAEPEALTYRGADWNDEAHAFDWHPQERET